MNLTREQRTPLIKWREPIVVSWPTGIRYSCRLCIAAHGLRADSPWQWPTEIEARDHIATEHPE